MMCPFTMTMSKTAPWVAGSAAPAGLCGKSVPPKESINKQSVATRIGVLICEKIERPWHGRRRLHILQRFSIRPKRSRSSLQTSLSRCRVPTMTEDREQEPHGASGIDSVMQWSCAVSHWRMSRTSRLRRGGDGRLKGCCRTSSCGSGPLSQGRL